MPIKTEPADDRQTPVTQRIIVVGASAGGFETMKDIEMAKQQGAICFFTKPYGFTELKRTLGLVARYLVNDLPPSSLREASLCRCDATS